VELGTHAELAFVLKPCWRGETAMVAGLLRHLRPGMLLLWDRNFFSYPLWKSLADKGLAILARVKCNLVLEPIQELADGSYTAKIYRSAYDRQKGRNGIVVRVIKYTLDDPRRVGHGEEHTLISTLLDADEHPATALIILYHERWEEELTFDEQKTHQDPVRPGKPTNTAERDASRSSAGGSCVVAGPLRDASADGPGGGDAGDGPGLVVVCGLPAHPAVPVARVRQPDTADLAGVVRGAAVGDELRAGGPEADAHRTATLQPRQPARDQTQDVQLEEEAPRTPQ
jgi:hypothetical protein